MLESFSPFFIWEIVGMESRSEAFSADTPIVISDWIRAWNYYETACCQLFSC